MPKINMQVFEEAQRNQLVTEVDIQTQVALDDYQVQLADIANPTQSQDNVVIDRFGEFLPHWSESLDFDTWVKVSMEVAGKRLLILRGNSSISSTSNGDDTFAQFANNGDASKFTPTNIALSDTDGYLRFYNASSSVAGYAKFHGFTIDSNKWILTSKLKNINIGDDDTVTIRAEDGSAADMFSAIFAPRRTDQTHLWVGWDIYSMSWTEGTEYIIKTVIDETDAATGWDTYLYSSSGALLDSSLNNALYVGSPIDLDILTIGDISSAGVCDARFKYIHLRKYTATEPTLVADGEQNIAVALKSLGRAG